MMSYIYVATVLTACGIETTIFISKSTSTIMCCVATVLTACGIETIIELFGFHILSQVATVLTACGIETLAQRILCVVDFLVATVLTACGIETELTYLHFFRSVLQQCLPLAVLKL